MEDLKLIFKKEIILLICILYFCNICQAQLSNNSSNQWPTKTVRIIVPMATGGGSDSVARLIAPKLNEQLSQPFIVDNRGGGGGLIGISMAVKSPPDGYTIMLISGSVPATIAAHKPDYDPIGNLAGIIRVGFSPLLLVSHPSIPVKNTKELIKFIQSKPNQLLFGVPGSGSLTHLATAYLMSITNTKMQHVPYKSTGYGMSDLLSGRTQVMMTGLSPMLPFIQNGKLRPIAVSTLNRWPAQPEIPALSETISGFDVESWFAFVTPKSTPSNIVSKLNTEINKLLNDQLVRKSFDALGIAVAGGGADDVDKRMRSEIDRWTQLIRDSKIQIDQ
jgi:tripartite-type tricarboxylate transporter receptor subunit TctC